MKKFNYPTTILYGEGALKESAKQIAALGFKKPLIVTDKTLVEVGIVGSLIKELESSGIQASVFDTVHPNPIEEDVENGTKAYHEHGCDSFIAVGGGSPMDAAKVIMIAATHEGPLERFDDTKGGDQHITNPLPPLFAIPTTAGTGSEVGRSGVVTLRSSGLKTIFFHPDLLPKIAVLEPALTTGLPPHITAATGLDAFTHCLEAYFARGFDPMGDGIALEGIRLVLENLPLAWKDGKNQEARAKMQLAASMGATAFQKGLGMIHSLAHPLSSECGLHHGLANALLLPTCVEFLEKAKLNDEQKGRIYQVQSLFQEFGLAKETLSQSIHAFNSALEIKWGLSNHGVREDQIDTLSDKAFDDPCHTLNMIDVSKEDLKSLYQKAF